ncbi:MAG: transglycosylase domain-containing protein [Clostridia bacterium]|nr:transglycosylase domain-containing protein [Clostridia bacterium]
MENSNERRTAPKKNGAVKASPQKTKKAKKKKRKHPVLYTIFLFCFCLFTAGMLTAMIVGGSVAAYMSNYVNGDIAVNLENYKDSQNQTSIMYAYDEDDKLIELTRLHGEENRIWVDYEDMPENLLWAFICLEDFRFYNHNGVDWIRTIAVIIKPEYEGQGASTITQQLIKNLTDENSATYFRKFHEITRALNLEKNYSKKDIIEAYLNTVALGAGCYGVKTAAETYFGKEVDELNLAECAMLAGITKAPYTTNPYVNMEKCKERQKRCLKAMVEEEKITQEQADKAYAKKVKIKSKSTSDKDSETVDRSEILSWYEEYVVDQVIADLQKEYDYDYTEAQRMIYYGGLKIYSAVDLRVQEILEDAYENRTGFPRSHYDSRGELPESSMTVMDYEGRIVALVGGTGKKTANRAYNRATDSRAKRQPGSSIKPLSVYAPAVDMGRVTSQSVILEEAIVLKGEKWPRNFNGDHGSGEYVTVENALARSLNTVPVRILNEMIGLENSIRYCNERFHLGLVDAAPPAGDKDLSPLGVGGTRTGVTTLEMAAAFATFGNGGRYYEPYSYYKVTDRNGNVLLDNTDNKPEQAIARNTASELLSMLTKAVTESYGTAYGSKISGFQTFAKTGTTSDNCDKWYCGGTPHYVTAVWYGFDYRADLRTGSSNPAKTIYRSVLSKVHSGLSSKTFTQVREDIDNKLVDVQQ